MLPSATARSRSNPDVRPVAGLAIATALLGFATGFGIAHVDLAARAAVPAAVAVPAAPTFDAVRFRAEERMPLAMPTFDAVRFRAEEREPLSATTP